MPKPVVARRLRIARLDAGHSVDGAAAAARVSARSIRAYEAGEILPGAFALTQLANLYGVSVDWLLGRDDPRASAADGT